MPFKASHRDVYAIRAKGISSTYHRKLSNTIFISMKGSISCKSLVWVLGARNVLLDVVWQFGLGDQ